ncbi:PKD domain-containing protein [Pseudofulvibacter geojedonensis]|uniref:PKD domain-containing protein n=1 Tax=Pseudofulvibacter geojedonensis TaxID=1123758 RepID=A0ABW3HZB5_9FLAO
MKNNIKTKLKFIVALMFVMIMILSCVEEVAVPVVTDFNAEIENNDYSVPVHVRITNITEGADTYNWSFPGGIPEVSSDRNPGTIIYSQPGNYTIRLEASNRDGSIDVKEKEISIYDAVQTSFTAEYIINNFPPMEVVLTNSTTGADSYQWLFEEGMPLSSTQQHPNNVVFNTPGDHIITLEVSNGIETFQSQQTVTVAPHLETNFSYNVNLEDNDFEAPVTLTMVNTCISATDYIWTFTGGTPSSSTEENPTVTYSTPGTYTINLEATNGKETQMISQTVTVLPNTNLRTFTDIEIGINTAHISNTKAAFFSTTMQRTYTNSEVDNSNGSEIDIAFYGLNQNFTYNKFVSPNQVQDYTFDAIPGANHTKFINSIETCNCSASMTVSEFDSMTDDTILDALTIEETIGGLQDFDNTIEPRIILFETPDERKGAIKIKDFVEDGQNSYVIVDIKVQKQ